MWQLHVIVSDSILMDWEKTTVKCVSAPLKVLHLHVGIPLYLNSAQCIPPSPCVLTLNGILHYDRLMAMVMVIGGDGDWWWLVLHRQYKIYTHKVLHVCNVYVSRNLRIS